MMFHKKILASIIAIFFLTTVFSHADESNLDKLVGEIFSVASPSGYEEAMVKKIMQTLPKNSATERDNIGSLYLSMGKGKEHIVILTGIDEIGYIVSGITPEGYLNLDRVVSAPHPIFDSFQFGHPMIVWTQKGPVSGVVALPSLHIFPRERRKELQNLFSLDNAFLDIGVQSSKEARERGVEFLDSVTPMTEISYLAGEKRAGFFLGNKTCTALLLDVVCGIMPQKLTQSMTFVWVAQTKFPHRRSRPRAALGALRVSKKLQASKFLIIDVFPCEIENQNEIYIGKGPILVLPKEGKSNLGSEIEETARVQGISLQHKMNFTSPIMNPFLKGNEEVVGLFLPVKFSSTPSEVVDFNDVKSLKKLLDSLLQ